MTRRRLFPRRHQHRVHRRFDDQRRHIQTLGPRHHQRFYTNGKIISTFASDVVNNAQFALENTGTANVTFSKVINGTSALTNTGLITLSASNTHTGNTTLVGGTASIPFPSLFPAGKSNKSPRWSGFQRGGFTDAFPLPGHLVGPTV